MSKSIIVLNDREKSLVNISQEEEYENYKLALRKSMINDIENKIQIMKILYNIKVKSLYLIDGYKSFETFINKFLIKKTQAYSYLKIYEYVLKGDLSIDDIKKRGVVDVYKSIKLSEVINKKSRVNPIKPLRFQLKTEQAYKFYKENSKFTGFLLEEIFSNEKKILEQLKIKYKNLKNN
ncbi:chromosome replication/partitioning protein (plasmid) [Borrelia miyamotoi]|uniref:Chromosome replication/partitioning protein n=1 Tax=Borrelia miyamotoi TaxID=47466 RepID=A0A5P8AVD5_9SPIR|nr:chromosome replication/partitioning protein [Borrelia miyamotoi]QFP42627.1 chromosome replication/partitioning protein [Borrelia miyamotoi]WAZ72485.1 chromosome replication/partitioning protein [Borrelia miyamotoi]WVI05410.1 chromosome replication/partitioning protein [Borrelia miyamotoi]